MLNASPYKCNYCGKVKGETNHWWVHPTLGPGTAFVLDTWDDTVALKPDVENICSEACASKALSKWMGEQKPLALREPLDPLGGDLAKAEGQ